MIDEGTLGSIASRYGIPPTILQAALRQGQGVPDHVVANMGLAQSQVSTDDNLQAEIAARALAQSFKDNGGWDAALSAYFTGNPQTDPNSPGASMAAATIGLAAITPTFGMSTYGVGGFDPSVSQSSFEALAKSWQPFAEQGGIITTQLIGNFQQQGNDLVSRWYQQNQRSAGQAGSSGGSAGNPGQPFANYGSSGKAAALRQYAYNAGFRGGALDTITAIGMAESGGNFGSLNNNPATQDYSVGAWQINYIGALRGPRTAAYGSPEKLQGDPQAQANAAFSISKGGTDFGSWTTYTKGTYRQYIGAGSQVQGPGGTYSTDQIPGGLVTSKVFNQQYGVTQGFGQNGEQGADFATPEGTPVFSGFSGTVHVQNYGTGYTGLSVWVDNGKGWQFFAGHMLNTSLQDGQQINAGDLMGSTGGGAQAAALGEQGHSTGAHSEIQIRQVLPNGQYIYHDPATLIANAGSTTGPIGGATLTSSQGFLNPADAPEVAQAAQMAVHTNTFVKQALQDNQPDKPQEPDTTHGDVAKFAMEAKAAGITDPSAFQGNLSYLSNLYHKLMGKAPTMADLAAIQGMTQDQARQYTMSQPHPTYPHLTVGDMSRTTDAASLYSTTYQNRMPYSSEVSRLIALNAGPKELQSYYSSTGGPQGSPTPPTTPTPPSTSQQAQNANPNAPVTRGGITSF